MGGGTAIVLILAMCVATVCAEKLLFEVKVVDPEVKERDGSVAPYLGDVCFYDKLPDPATVDKIIRASLQSTILINPARNIMMMAFKGDDTLNSNQHSGTLLYRCLLYTSPSPRDS